MKTFEYDILFFQVKKQKEKEEKLEAEGRKIRLRTEHVDYSEKD